MWRHGENKVNLISYVRTTWYARGVDHPSNEAKKVFFMFSMLNFCEMIQKLIEGTVMKKVSVTIRHFHVIFT